MSLLKHIVGGVASMLSISATPLYRYPYRNGEEAFRGDWQRIEQDIASVLDRNGKRTDS